MRSMKLHWLVWCLLNVLLIFFLFSGASYLLYLVSADIKHAHIEMKRFKSLCEDSRNTVVSTDSLRQGYVVSQDQVVKSWVCVDYNSFKAVAIADMERNNKVSTAVSTAVSSAAESN